MEIRKLKLALILLCIGAAMTINAQSLIDKADKQFEMKAYDLAINNYQTVLKQDPSCLDCQFKMGECFRFMNMNLEAYDLFRGLEGKYDFADYYLSFGKVLKKLGKYEEAGDMFTHYAMYDREKGIHYAESCGFAIDVLSSPDQRRVELADHNSKEDDFSCTLYKGDMLMASFRTDQDPYATTDYSLLYKKDGSSISLLQDALLGDVNVSSLSFDKSNQTCAYFKHKFGNGMHAIDADEKNLAIFFAKLDGRANFLKEIPFSYNSTDYSNAFPCFTDDSQSLFFSSNMPGGYGGFDLYVTHLTESGWTKPVNLGGLVNTAGNEISPMVKANQLFFSSDYHFGMGGYDIFTAEIRNGEYMPPRNMGKGINSPEDEFYPFYDLGNDEFYFSSNRIGGKGKLDIYVASGTQETDYMLTAVLPEPKAQDNPDVYILEDLSQKEPKLQTVSYNENAAVFDAANKPMAVAINRVDFSHVYDNTGSVEHKAETRFDDFGINPTSDNEIDDSEISVETIDLSSEAISTETEVIETTESIITSDANVEETIETSSITSSSSTASIDNDAPYVVYDVVDAEEKTDVAIDEAFFIQLGSFRESRGNINKFGKLSNFGSLYRIFSDGFTKIRLGYFYDRNQAELVLGQIKQEGFRDAFITKFPIHDATMEIVYPDENYDDLENNNKYEKPYVTPSPHTTSLPKSNNVQVVETAPLVTYKVRLAAYEDPIWFDINKVKDLGNIEQWRKGKWTIFILSGYSSMDNARYALNQAIERGFNGASIVLDDNGILKSVDY